MTTSSSIVEQRSAPPARPLWRKVWEFPLIAMAAALALVAVALAAVPYSLAWADPEALDPLVRETVPGLLAVALVFLVTKFAISRLGRFPRDDLPLGAAPAHLVAGLGLGFAIFALAVAIAALAGVYRITGWGTLQGWVGFFMAAGVVAGFVEEVIFRGIIFRWIEELAGSWAALGVSAALFGLAHIANDNATVFSSIAIAIEAGVLLGAAYMLTRSLWLAIGIHAGWNLTQGLIFDVSVSGNAVDGIVEAELTGPAWLSGGAFGLEASVIALVVATGAGLIMLRMAARRGQITPPMWSRSRGGQD
ncbi:MAG: CPBP family intramembrane glutamic endopeptidase [Erythrobacter sp.]|jgi:membrane protease YdiL (CAAX protease family)|nr:CPBP family intramembrane glutamic endopeptidase [Erythrobacter sp.]